MVTRVVPRRVGDPRPIEAPYMILLSVLPTTLVLGGDLFFLKTHFSQSCEDYLCKYKCLIHKYFWFLWSFKCSDHRCDRMLGI